MVIITPRRKLLLAPAVTAVALSGLIAAPAFADTKAPSDTPSIPAGATKVETAAPQGKAQNETPKATAHALKALEQDQITQSDLQSKGVPIKLDISGLSDLSQTLQTRFTDSKNKVVAGADVKTDDKGHFEGSVKAKGEVAPGDVKLEVLYKGQVIPGSDLTFKVVADAPKPTVTFSTTKDFPKVSGENLAPNTPVKIDLKNAAGNDFPQLDTPSTDDKGAFGPYAVSPNAGPFEDQVWTVTVTVGDFTKTQKITIGDGKPSEITISDPKVSQSQVKKDGLKIKGSGFQPNETLEIFAGPRPSAEAAKGATGKAEAADADTVPTVTFASVKADAKGDVNTSTKPNEALPVGDYTLYVSGGAAQAHANFSVAKDAPVKPSITANPKKVSAKDFENAKKGVNIEAKGYQPGEKVTATATQDEGKVEKFTLDETADENGVVSFKLYAIGTAVVGTYHVTLVGATTTDPLTTSFTVVADDSDGNGGGNGNGDDNNNGNGGGSSEDPAAPAGDVLPRTGANLGGLGGGVALLVLGAAAVVVTRRRSTKASADPADV